MELDREKIVKALECCNQAGVGGVLDDACAECPFWKSDNCMNILNVARNFINELAEENEKLRAELASRPPKLIITKRR